MGSVVGSGSSGDGEVHKPFPCLGLSFSECKGERPALMGFFRGLSCPTGSSDGDLGQGRGAGRWFKTVRLFPCNSGAWLWCREQGLQVRLPGFLPSPAASWLQGSGAGDSPL